MSGCRVILLQSAPARGSAGTGVHRGWSGSSGMWPGENLSLGQCPSPAQNPFFTVTLTLALSNCRKLKDSSFSTQAILPLSPCLLGPALNSQTPSLTGSLFAFCINLRVPWADLSLCLSPMTEEGLGRKEHRAAACVTVSTLEIL